MRSGFQVIPGKLSSFAFHFQGWISPSPSIIMTLHFNPPLIKCVICYPDNYPASWEALRIMYLLERRGNWELEWRSDPPRDTWPLKGKVCAFLIVSGAPWTWSGAGVRGALTGGQGKGQLGSEYLDAKWRLVAGDWEDYCHKVSNWTVKVGLHGSVRSGVKAMERFWTPRAHRDQLLCWYDRVPWEGLTKPQSD